MLRLSRLRHQRPLLLPAEALLPVRSPPALHNLVITLTHRTMRFSWSSKAGQPLCKPCKNVTHRSALCTQG